MKHLALIVAFLFVTFPAVAGMSYQFTSTTSGTVPQTLSGTVEVEGSGMSVDFQSGDGVFFKKGMRAVTGNGGRTMSVIDPSTRSFYQLDLATLLGEGLLKQFGGLLKLDVRDPKVSVRETGSGPAIAGFPTRKSNVTSSYQLMLDTFGQKVPIRIAMATDVWWTDKLAAELTNPLQMRGLRTGIDALDQLLAAQTQSIKGFPLKQVTSTRISMAGTTMNSKTTSEVSNVKRVTIAPARFVVPAGYVLAPSPIEKLMKR